MTDFPVLVSGTYTYLKTTANGGDVQNANGYDIGFYSDLALTTKLKWETERYIATTGEVVYWVKVPTVATATDTVIYLAYGDSGISTDQSDAVNTWNSNYAAVWHFPDGTTLGMLDSTSNNNDGSTAGAVAIAGQIDGAADFSSTAITVTNSASLAFGPNFSFSAWVTSDTLPSGFISTVFHKENAGLANYELRLVGSDLGLLNYDGADHGCTWTISGWSTGVQHHLSGGYNGTAWKLFFDGTQVATNNDATGAATGGTGDLEIGNSYGNRYWDGIIDNLNFSNTYRGADWFATEYNNQFSPSTFYTISSPLANFVGFNIALIKP